MLLTWTFKLPWWITLACGLDNNGKGKAFYVRLLYLRLLKHHDLQLRYASLNLLNQVVRGFIALAAYCFSVLSKQCI